VETIASLVIGALIGAVVSWYFARNSSKELRAAVDEIKAETALLKRHHTLLLNILEDNDLARLNRDAGGAVVGRMVEQDVGATMKPSARVESLVLKGRQEPGSKDAEHG
jgi:gas vesicle protein